MKSAYELAMERLEKEDPQSAAPISEAQKASLQETETRYRARIAEREVFLNGKLQEARIARDHEAASQLEKQLRNERQRLQEECESEKNKIRQGND